MEEEWGTARYERGRWWVQLDGTGIYALDDKACARFGRDEEPRVKVRFDSSDQFATIIETHESHWRDDLRVHWCPVCDTDSDHCKAYWR